MSGRIIVSQHAVDRARERYRNRGIARRGIELDVLSALQAGRIACKPPRAFRTQPRPKSKVGRAVRYCWTESQDRCYVISDRRSDGRNGFRVGARLTIVVSAIAPGISRAAA